MQARRTASSPPPPSAARIQPIEEDSQAAPGSLKLHYRSINREDYSVVAWRYSTNQKASGQQVDARKP